MNHAKCYVNSCAKAAYLNYNLVWCTDILVCVRILQSASSYCGRCSSHLKSRMFSADTSRSFLIHIFFPWDVHSDSVHITSGVKGRQALRPQSLLPKFNFFQPWKKQIAKNVHWNCRQNFNGLGDFNVLDRKLCYRIVGFISKRKHDSCYFQDLVKRKSRMKWYAFPAMKRLNSSWCTFGIEEIFLLRRIITFFIVLRLRGQQL